MSRRAPPVPRRPLSVGRKVPMNRRVVVHVNPGQPVCRVEVEVFDVVIGDLRNLVANDNEPPVPEKPQGAQGESCSVRRTEVLT
jgi:hypothetical protein